MPLTSLWGSFFKFLPVRKVYCPPQIDGAYWHIDFISKSLISWWIDPLDIDDIPSDNYLKFSLYNSILNCPEDNNFRLLHFASPMEKHLLIKVMHLTCVLSAQKCTVIVICSSAGGCNNVTVLCCSMICIFLLFSWAEPGFSTNVIFPDVILSSSHKGDWTLDSIVVLISYFISWSLQIQHILSRWWLSLRLSDYCDIIRSCDWGILNTRVAMPHIFATGGSTAWITTLK